MVVYGSIRYRGSSYVVTDADDLGDVHVWSGDPDSDDTIRIATVHVRREYPSARFRTGYAFNWRIVRDATALYRAAAGALRECDR